MQLALVSLKLDQQKPPASSQHQIRESGMACDGCPVRLPPSHPHSSGPSVVHSPASQGRVLDHLALPFGFCHGVFPRRRIPAALCSGGSVSLSPPRQHPDHTPQDLAFLPPLCALGLMLSAAVE